MKAKRSNTYFSGIQISPEYLDSLVAFVLALGILPSLTALSTSLQEWIPSVYRYTGPINIFKIAIPLLLYFVWRNRLRINRRPAIFYGGVLFLGTLATVLAGIPCAFPATLTREWFVIGVGFLAALSFTLLPNTSSRRIVQFFCLVVYGVCALNLASPRSIDWLLSHFFDPQTLDLDIREIGQRVLTGIFGRQSLAKLLSWLPWLLMAVSWKKKPSLSSFLALSLIGVLSTGMILGTSQRGPFLAALIGWLAFAFHQHFRAGMRHALPFVGAAIGLAMVTTAIFVPRSVLEPRVRSLFGMKQSDQYGALANENGNFRVKMAIFSLKTIAESPLGNACVNTHLMFAAGITHWSHAHNLILQQYRERGWLWGSIHLFLWLGALWGAWTLRSYEGSALFAGLTAVLVGGMFDHPWPVLNHSFILWIFLLKGLSQLKFLGPLARPSD